MAFVGSYIWQLRQHVGSDEVLVPGSIVVVRNPAGEILLVKRSDTGTWAPPAGNAEIDDSFASTAVRELEEETDIRTEPAALVPFACLSDPKLHRVEYPNGHKVHAFAMCFLMDKYTGPVAEMGDENTEIAWFRLNELPELFGPTEHVLRLLREYEESGRFQVS